MTLCVGIEKRGRVWIGADSGTSDFDSGRCEQAFEPKVWKQNNGWIMATAGDWRSGSLIMLAARFPKPPDNYNDAYRVIALDVIQEMKRVFELYGVDPTPEKDGEGGTDWLIGAKGAGLFAIDAWNHVSRVTEFAIGHQNYAEGWLDGSPITDPELRIKECIKSAAKRRPGAVKLPITIIEAP